MNIDLVLQLWRRKWIIGAFVVLFIVFSGIYINVIKERWTSFALISPPDAAQITTYANALNILYGGDASSMQDIQNRAIGDFHSSFSDLALALENKDISEKLTIDTTVKDQPFSLIVTCQANSAQSAQKILTEYIQQVDNQTAKELALSIKGNIQQQIAMLNDQLETQKKIAEEQKDLRIKQITEALKNAEAANITSPLLQQTQDVTQETMFLMGSEALQSMIDNEASRPLVFPDTYYQIKKNTGYREVERDPRYHPYL